MPGADPSLACRGADLLPLVYTELRKLASARLAGDPGCTLQPTALVHEAWLRLGGERQWHDRTHFFAAAAEAMRHILIDRARRRQTQRHGGGCQRAELEIAGIASETDDERLLALNEAIDALSVHDPAKADLVKLRYFAGLSLADAAHALGISEPTAKRWWRYARVWLRREIQS
jgi:RNA polymerase sigma factor (TIGR02999 family)